MMIKVFGALLALTRFAVHSLAGIVTLLPGFLFLSALVVVISISLTWLHSAVCVCLCTW